MNRGMIALTGATGFIGRPLCEALLGAGYRVRAMVRRADAGLARGAEAFPCADLAALSPAQARQFCAGAQAIVHVAGDAHAVGDENAARHQAITADATRILAEASAPSGAHFIFLSSIRAQTGPSSGHVVSETDAPHPEDAYGRAKLSAEDAIRASLPLQHTILRPVLVCGVGAKGHLAALLRLADTSFPLPLAGIIAQRSLISRADLIDIVLMALDDARFIGKTLIAADPTPVTIGEMVAALRAGLDRPPRLFSLPQPILERLLVLGGRKHIAERVFGALAVRPETLLAGGWAPREGALNALHAMGRARLELGHHEQA